jgi:hypothetical protein
MSVGVLVTENREGGAEVTMFHTSYKTHAYIPKMITIYLS